MSVAALQEAEYRKNVLLRGFKESEYARQEALAMFPLEVANTAQSLLEIIEWRRVIGLAPGPELAAADECARILERDITQHLIDRLGLGWAK